MMRPVRAGVLLAPLLAGCAASGGEPVDLVRHARLRADRTAPVEGLLWPREAEDAIATVRDGHAGTGWKPPAGEQSEIEIDLGPWPARAVRLDSLGMTWEGEPPGPVAVKLSAGCGQPSEQSFMIDDPSMELDLQSKSAVCVRVLVNPPGRSVLTGLELFSRDPGIEIPAVDIVPAPQKWANSGVVEGFYGVPWSFRERRHLLYALAALGLGSYVYAPKEDALHRARWREPYPEEFVAEFAALARLADELGVRLYFGISPLIDFDFSAEGDFAALAGKVRVFLEAGARGVVLLADDIEFEMEGEIDAALGARHAALANRLLEEIARQRPGARLWFVPTVYSDARLDSFSDGEGYLQEISALDPGIEILWTGTDTFCKTMSPGDLDRFRGLTGRKPVIWDNYFANDGGDGFVGRLLLSPFGGRGPELLDSVAGIVLNPGIQGALARLQAAMLGAFLDGRADQLEWASQLETGFGDQDGDAVRFVMRMFTGNGMDMPRFPEMEEAIGRLSALLDRPGGAPLAELAGEAGPLLPLFARMAVLDSELHHGTHDADLVDDLAFALERARREGEEGMWALAALGEKLAGRDGADAIARARRARNDAAGCRFVLSPGAVSGLLDLIDALEPMDLGFSAPAAGPMPEDCRAGRALVWEVFSAGATSSVFGLPGARLEDGALRWTPPHPGSFRGAAAAYDERGFVFVPISLVCR